ncbi:MAG: DNA alkylation repair protein [Candidatus Heimdallarchaeota archaeon]|nr:DNA alkylation repair protein [Candidatus Heimdallarchaeota archaeon]
MSLSTEELIAQLLFELEKKVSPKKPVYYKKTTSPSEFRALGIRTPAVRKIANASFRMLKEQNITAIDEVLGYCDALLQERISELRTIAVQWSSKCKKQFQPKHFKVFEQWLNESVTGWGSCDDLCVKSLGEFLFQYPEFIPRIKQNWTTSENLWVRRASAVIFIYSLRREKYLEHIFDIADALFTDEEKYVLKGYGWMLKEASNKFQTAVYDYVKKRKATMPRLSLRYAIEKMPEPMRKELMSR